MCAGRLHVVSVALRGGSVVVGIAELFVKHM